MDYKFQNLDNWPLDEMLAFFVYREIMNFNRSIKILTPISSKLKQPLLAGAVLLITVKGYPCPESFREGTKGSRETKLSGWKCLCPPPGA